MIEASVWFSRWICTPSLASTAWCRPVGPAPARHQAAGELVDDDDLVVLHHVVLVAVDTACARAAPRTEWCIER